MCVYPRYCGVFERIDVYMEVSSFFWNEDAVGFFLLVFTVSKDEYIKRQPNPCRRSENKDSVIGRNENENRKKI